MSSAELTGEAVELSKGMLGLIGAYGMRSAAVDVGVMYRKAARQSRLPERSLASAGTKTTEGTSYRERLVRAPSGKPK